MSNVRDLMGFVKEIRAADLTELDPSPNFELTPEESNRVEELVAEILQKQFSELGPAAELEVISFNFCADLGVSMYLLSGDKSDLRNSSYIHDEVELTPETEFLFRKMIVWLASRHPYFHQRYIQAEVLAQSVSTN